MYNKEHKQTDCFVSNRDRGVFLTLEGIDGSGKSTQMKYLNEFLQAAGKETVVIREPGGTVIGESIRSILLSPANAAMAVETELLLFAAARAQLVQEVIRPALARGAWVICDRFMDSTTAYQGYGRGIDLKMISKLHSIAVGDCLPDLTLLLDLPMDKASARLKSRPDKADRLDQESLSFMERTRNGYLILAEAEPERFRLLDADQPETELEKQIQLAIREGTGL